MKRSISIILVTLVLMNVMGYYGLLVGLQYRHTQNMLTRIESGTFSELETRSLKIPLPGNAGSEKYERVDGEFEQNGQVFRLVKQRLYKDTFHIVFIKDEMGTLIKHALADYAKSFSEKSQDDDQQLIILPVFIREYISRAYDLVPTGSGLVMDIERTSHTKIFIDSFVSRIVHPPERA
ncbi:MAG TPA: hypothetical protein VGD40_09230 [Chryseosolibacter sp.]